jgi:hypothetical protein
LPGEQTAAQRYHRTVSYLLLLLLLPPPPPAMPCVRVHSRLLVTLSAAELASFAAQGAAALYWQCVQLLYCCLLYCPQQDALMYCRSLKYLVVGQRDQHVRHNPQLAAVLRCSPMLLLLTTHCCVGLAVLLLQPLLVQQHDCRKWVCASIALLLLLVAQLLLLLLLDSGTACSLGCLRLQIQ